MSIFVINLRTLFNLLFLFITIFSPEDTYNAKIVRSQNKHKFNIWLLRNVRQSSKFELLLGIFQWQTFIGNNLKKSNNKRDFSVVLKFPNYLLELQKERPIYLSTITGKKQMEKWEINKRISNKHLTSGDYILYNVYSTSTSDLHSWIFGKAFNFDKIWTNKDILILTFNNVSCVYFSQNSMILYIYIYISFKARTRSNASSIEF